ncbi:MAG: hypothetical protein F4Y02_18450 [Chloroflexi bacterium]|nr:hypothetical protein [Chloroflexota bacterium]
MNQSFHRAQMVVHGPVWYTDDVHEFILACERDHPIISWLYPVFVKSKKYSHQREYRFVIHCESRIADGDTLLLPATRELRHCLTPVNTRSSVAFSPPEDPNAKRDPSATVQPKVTATTRTKRRRDTRQNKRVMRDQATGAVVEESTETYTRQLEQQEVREGDDHPWGEALVNMQQSSTYQRQIGDTYEERSTKDVVLKGAVLTADSDLFSFEDQDYLPMDLWEAARQPFTESLEWPRSAALPHLARLAMKTVSTDPDTNAMAACWNAIWAVSNLCARFADIIASVDIELDEYVAITLKPTSTNSPSRCKLLVGPRGTFAYVISDDAGLNLPRTGGTAHRLFLFPDPAAMGDFTRFGWTPIEDIPDGNDNPPDSPA